MRSPSVRKSNLPKASVVESTFEALADLKRTLSKKKLAIADNNESTEEVETSKSKRETKRAGTPDNHSKRESIGNRDRPSSSLMNHSSSKQNLQSNNPNPNISVSKDSKETQETGDKALQEEVEKWKKFGKMMADSYEELNNKFTSFMKESEKDKKVIHALKEQVIFVYFSL